MEEQDNYEKQEDHDEGTVMTVMTVKVKGNNTP
jgi:hypothetical protein